MIMMKLILTKPPQVTDYLVRVTTTSITLSWNAIGGESFGSNEGYIVSSWNGSSSSRT